MIFGDEQMYFEPFRGRGEELVNYKGHVIRIQSFEKTVKSVAGNEVPSAAKLVITQTTLAFY
jgi:hypothetical protein